MASHSIFEIVVLLAAVMLYFLPAMIADRRKRHDLLIIALFNAVVGWTVLGWFLALFWSLQPNPPRDIGDNVQKKKKIIGMQLFSRRLDARAQARQSRNADREGSSR
ncbi:superinfection immunity protein [Burkholderia sp. Ax-1719]|jgi:NADH:ubiquinone oxidoreductase subunit 6 (subunit J)|uniref:superinfection immunity protein n=1 Tax=Burkholderia sp. Ax-1719 TaxID=2608334 RepID=UPI00142178A5|nr:superinfection immunity protein [Burkholderia sp. Ax-1719]NIE65822.1 superinfection immunity protein [Burkholderia sp. Ax-1719]